MKVSTWNARRAAIIYCLKSRLLSQLALQDRYQRLIKNLKDVGLAFNAEFQRWTEAVETIGQLHIGLVSIFGASGLPLEKRTQRHSKKGDMKKLPDDWRETLIARLPNYYLEASTMAATGCRPVELVFGVRLQIEPTAISALVHGAKGGQEWRIFRWQLDHPSAVIQHLIQETKDSHGSLLVQAHCGRALTGAVRSAGKRAWPSRSSSITSYCFRHQMASDMKASGRFSDEEISAALGHISSDTKTRYGHFKMGSSSDMTPLSIEFSHPVKVNKPKPLPSISCFAYPAK